jgi:hypothetical protein
MYEYRYTGLLDCTLYRPILSKQRNLCLFILLTKKKSLQKVVKQGKLSSTRMGGALMTIRLYKLKFVTHLNTGIYDFSDTEWKWTTFPYYNW